MIRTENHLPSDAATCLVREANKTLHAIERLAAASRLSESVVARHLLDCMTRGDDSKRLASHWLENEGRHEFEGILGIRHLLPQAWTATWRLNRSHAYFGTFAMLTVLAILSLTDLYNTRLLPGEANWGLQAFSLLILVLVLLPASEVITVLMNRLLCELTRPTHLSRLQLAEGIPACAQTLVVIPSMLCDKQGIDKLVHRLRLHYLANPERHAQFALLSDWPDADSRHADDDESVLAHAMQTLQALNDQYPAEAGQPLRFLLLHRQRSYSATQGLWMGWERKRGKLEQLVAALATDSQGAFLDIGELSETARATRYLVTLDSDTEMPPGSLRALAGVALHPDNQPLLDNTGQRVIKGYGILQPLVVGPLPTRKTVTPWQWLLSGQRGLDPYSAMSSDVYQDVFGEGSFMGKGLLHVATAHAVLGSRLPIEQILSHDLLEGALARCAVVTDITLIEDEPNHSDLAAARLHRWTRGDWQLLPYLLFTRQWPMAAINRWKMIDNLRRSLVMPACLLLIVLSMAGHGFPLSIAIGMTLAACAGGPMLGALASSVPAQWRLVGPRLLRTAAAEVMRALGAGLWHIATLLQQTIEALDAILRTLYRLLVSRRQLLTWKTADAAQAGLCTGLKATVLRHWREPLLAVLLLAGLFIHGTPVGLTAWALLLIWASAPLLVWVMNTPWTVDIRRASLISDQTLLQGVARDTWRLFERCVTAENHHLPPDNLQLSPFESIAHRTSPTNIGLYMLSVACARQFGWIGTQELLARLESTLHTLRQLQRHNGHFLNWYDTRTLNPLLPRYVSTVDSGNLSAHLLAVAQACRDLSTKPLDPSALNEALRQSTQRLEPFHPLIAHLIPEPGKQALLQQLLRSESPDPGDVTAFAEWKKLLITVSEAITALMEKPGTGVKHPIASDRQQLVWLLNDHLSTLISASLDRAATGPANVALANGRLNALAQALEHEAWAPDFGCLYHSKRHLLHIGYRLDDQALDTAFYDLLASESHITSLVGIAKGDLPIRNWSALGRPFFASGRHALLLSWSGSMFEYLMPALITPYPQGSALKEANQSAVREQIASGRRQDLPWGVSESAYSGRDESMSYQYAPQGVAQLALRRHIGDERVVAPYATCLAAMVDPHEACRNLRKLEAYETRGRYGFIEALDFTPSRQTRYDGCTRVVTYMAHHQGMTIVALANVLLDGIAQRWGMSHPRLQAIGSLLHERAPHALPRPYRPSGHLHHVQQRHPPPRMQVLTPDSSSLPPTLILTNGSYSVTVRPNGAGWSRLGQTGISRWRDDSLRDAHGSFIYLRREIGGTPVSITSHPAPDPQATYQSRFCVDRACFETTWPDLQLETTVWVSPEDDIELRKVHLTNLGDKTLDIELIAALDITLVNHANDEAHPAFSSMFVQAEWLSQQRALRFVRTPRLSTERAVYATLFLADIAGDWSTLHTQTDRQSWLGRNRPPDHPQALMTPAPAASGPLNTGLDPVAALSVVLRLPPGSQACATFAVAASHDKEALASVVDRYLQPSYVERSSAVSATLASIHTAPFRLHNDYLPAFHAMTTALVMTVAKLDTSNPLDTAGYASPQGQSDKRLLWPLGLSGDRPIILIHAGPIQGLALLRIVALMLREWARAGIACDLVVISEERYAHHMPLQQAFMHMCNQHREEAAGRREPNMTGFHLLDRSCVTASQMETFRRLARVQLRADGQPLLHQIKAWGEQYATQLAAWRETFAYEPIPTCRAPLRANKKKAPMGQFDPTTGAFSFMAGQDPKQLRPWINVLANPEFGCLVTETGGGYTWGVNSHLNQLSPWSNDPVSDPPGEWFLLQDRRSREVWSMTPSAWGDHTTCSHVTHAQGLTHINQDRGSVSMSLSWCVDPDAAVKQIRIRLTNRGSRKEHLRLVGMIEWILGNQRSHRSSLHTTPVYESHSSKTLTALLCTQTDATSGLHQGTAFFCESRLLSAENTNDVEHIGGAGLDWTCNRQAFFDSSGRLSLPQKLGQQAGSGLDPCGALSRLITLNPGARTEQVFLIGYAADIQAAKALAQEARVRSAEEREQRVMAKWNTFLSAVEVHTPDPLLDVLVNRWLPYQTVSSRLWAKAAFYQAGGATGFRDQLQDAMALTLHAPDILRDQILLCASRQFELGDVQHWWHAPTGAGVRTHSSDDLLWLPFACAHYLSVTGDTSILDERSAFLQGKTVPTGAEDAYDTPLISPAQASVYEHAARTIDHSLRVGLHGLPLMGSGDWNDGMNRVGHEGRGESVWLGWFLCRIVQQWAPLARQCGDNERAQRWEDARQGWLHALEAGAWDGEWYLRAFFDDGSPLGSHAGSEASIDMIAQAWSVLSQAAPADRQHRAMDAVEFLLVDHDHGLLHLLTPALACASPSAGYIQAYPPGVRENGGQYTHAGVWALMAAAQLAQSRPEDPSASDRPYRYFTYLSPAHRAFHPTWGPDYGLEPYAAAADVYSEPPYAGRGGWSWYTGASGWLHRSALESLFGLHVEGQELYLTPCLPTSWPRAELILNREGRQIRIVLFRGSSLQARADCGIKEAQQLQASERVRWTDLPQQTCFFMTLPLAGA